MAGGWGCRGDHCNSRAERWFQVQSSKFKVAGTALATRHATQRLEEWATWRRGHSNGYDSADSNGYGLVAFAMDSNPYSSPAVVPSTEDSNRCPSSPTAGILSTTLRRIALAVFLLPFLLAYPVRYWGFNIAGKWFVSTDIDPDERQVHLRFMTLLVLAAISAAVPLPGLLLLYVDNYRLRLTGFLIFPASIYS
jgi:hypothetical protein